MKNKITLVLKQQVFWQALIAISVTQAASAGLAILTQQVLDCAVNLQLMKLMRLLILYFICFELIIFTDFLAQYWRDKFAVQIEVNLKNQLGKSVLKKGQTEFSLNASSVYQSSYTNEIPTIVNDFYERILLFCQGLLGVIFSLLALRFLDPMGVYNILCK